MAYGSAGTQTIPPNSALVFDLALTAVTPPQ
jgi:FKBP-type peptidyl-prolyl cis-trans isomerase